MDAPGRIRELRYDAASRTLLIHFHGGRSFRIVEVDPAVYVELADAGKRDNVLAAKLLGKVGWVEITPLPPSRET